MKVAYLLGPGRLQYTGRVTLKKYYFTPWADVDERDCPQILSRHATTTGCCGKPARRVRVFGTEQEVADQVVGFIK